MKLQTPVTDLECRCRISLDEKMFFIGSCFAENIGKKLSCYGFDVCVNPFGTLYNPVSILNSFRRMVSGLPFTVQDCVMMGSGSALTCSFSHHTSFARETPEKFLSDANAALEKASESLYESSVVVITLGTAWCYRHKESGLTVSNCLKRDAKEFERYRLEASQVCNSLREMVSIVAAFGKHKRFIFTVSPIRHFKDGAHGNQLSKATLLLGTDTMLSDRTSDVLCDYFPAYEIVMDELRDYRFYSEDMLHPSQQTEDYILERFLGWALPAEERTRLEDNIRTYRRSCHRPLQKF
ncbi:MAG: GSCFA domain-containing protein [Candidatus Cryptobacteroides sp.]